MLLEPKIVISHDCESCGKVSHSLLVNDMGSCYIRIKTDDRTKTFRLHANEVKLDLLFNTMHAVQDVLDLFSMEWMDESEVIEDE